MAFAVAGTLLAPAAQATAGPDFSKIWQPPDTPLPGTTSVNVTDVAKAASIAPHYPVPSRAGKMAAPAPTQRASATVDLSGAQAKGPLRAGKLPVWVAPKPGAPATSQAVTVVQSDGQTAHAAGVNGLLFTLTAQPQSTSAATAPATRQQSPTTLVLVAVDVAALNAATGGEFASRGRLVKLPACAATTPASPSCQVRTPVAAHFEQATGRMVAEVPLPAATPARTGAAQSSFITGVHPAAAPTGAPLLLAAETGPAGGGGTYAASTLSPSSAWAAGSASGALTYSYPVQVPPSLGGAAPTVGLSYNSSSVDGKTSATNAQASWAGDGWELNPGFIERDFKPCDKSGIADSGDQCWGGFNATLSLGSHSGQLVRDRNAGSSSATTDAATGVWHPKDDDGTKIEFGSGAGNDARDGAYAKVTDSSGTVYYFGLNHLPGGDKSDPAANSVSTLPVYSPGSGDPCYDSAQGKASWCQMWQRLSLDYVVDPKGNLTTYTWAPETNWYARGAGQNNGTGTRTSYTRANLPASIAYGQRLDEQLAAKGALQPAERIAFATAERCLDSATCDPAQRTSANKNNWPDVPVDQECKQDGTCTHSSPSFFTTKRLSTITTQVRINNAWKDVDSYKLTHSFPDPKDNTSQKALWLDSVERTGKTATPELSTLPVTFTPVMLPNRVDGTDLVPAPPLMNRPRIQQIHNETGGVLNVDYNLPGCSRINKVMPAAEDDNSMACYPIRWLPSGSVADADPVLDWFNHYTVASLTENDTATDAPQKITKYTYESAGWHRDDAELTETKARTWGDFRGFRTVTTTVGSGTDGPRAQTRTTYRQGMDGDVRQDAGSRSVHLTDALGRDVVDVDWLAGQPLQSETFDQADGKVTARTVNGASGEVATATHSRGTGLPDLVARYTATTQAVTSQALKADQSWRTTTKTTVTDPSRANRLLTSLDQADGLPDLCTRTAYATGPDPQRTDLAAETLTLSGPNACTAAAGPSNTTARSRVLYDNLPFGQAAASANPSGAQELERYESDGSATFTTKTSTTFDKYGRTESVTALTVKDALHPNGATTRTSYAAAAAGELPSALTSSAPIPGAATGSWDTVTTIDPRRGNTLTVKDPNSKTSTQVYDALGRLTGVWLAGRNPAANANANLAYAYNLSNKAGVPSSVTTSVLKRDLAMPVYTRRIDILDGFGRTRQAQASPANPAYTGRMITDSLYDSQGRVKTANAAWYNNVSGPTTTLVQAAESTIPAQTRTTYDGRGRATVVASWSLGVEQNRTTTVYAGVDRIDLLPPAGTWPTSSVSNARDKTVERWQYNTPTATGNPADAVISRYTYTADGKPETRTDAVGNRWSYGYDQQDRQISASDPDTGTVVQTFDEASRVATTTDNRGRKLVFTYELTGRKTGVYEGSVAPANQLAGWSYDTVIKGKPASATRYVGGAGGQAYTTAVKGYDDAYRPTGLSITIPGSEVGLASGNFTYAVSSSFDKITGNLKSTLLPALGGLPMDDMAYSYNDYGQLFKYAGATTYDTQTEYDAFGRVIRSTVNPWASQVVVTNDYDQATGRLRNQFLDKQTSASGAVQQTGYTYDDSGRVTSISSTPDNTPVGRDLQCFDYDSLGRLNTAWTDTGSVTVPDALQHQTQDQGRCTNTSPTSGAIAPAQTTVGGGTPYWQEYGYDVTGNRTRFVQHDTSGDATKDSVTTQTFPSAGTVNTGGGSGGPHALTGTSTKVGTSTTVSGNDAYDAAGNTTGIYTSKTGTADLTWNSEGKLGALAQAGPITGIGGKCLDMQGGSSANGNPLQIDTCTSGGGQRFATNGGLLKVFSKCITAMGTAAGSVVQLQPCDGRASQNWTVRADGTILNAAATRCLAVPGNVTTNGTDLAMGDCATPLPAGQKWTVPNQTTSYVYDADGNQLIRRNPGKTTINLGTDQVTYDTVAKTLTGTRYYPVPGGLSMVRVGAGGLTIQLADHHNSGTLTVDATSLAVTRRPMDPFGNPRGTQPAPGVWAGDKGFVGGSKDDVTSLTNLGAREYQPSTGRFLCADPLLVPDDPQQWNSYGYSHSDPVNRSDPSGLYDPDQRAWEQEQRRANQPASESAGDSEPVGLGEDEPTKEEEKWWKVWQPRHDTAVLMVTAYLKAKHPYNDFDNDVFIRGASAKGNGEPGYADIVEWGKNDVTIWEVKHQGGAAEKAGPAQLARYVSKMQAMLVASGDTRRVKIGEPLGVELGPVPNFGNPAEFITAKDSGKAGIISYTWSREDTRGGEPDPVPHPVPGPQPNPMQLKERGRRPDWTSTRPIKGLPAGGLMPHAAPSENGGDGLTFNVPKMTPQQQEDTGVAAVVGFLGAVLILCNPVT
ncbi:ricin-type beta-trefoil lectin domain protein [Streptomyces sp. H39-C1]|uniref:ricin-type beta-trefoil lectin domain protein n=1 Tax=Streptomyces sp. H39-C1 TaxID=3004355 RepID=UPI0022AF7DCF|nr:ricin-type beta-trefoil lectin domain protein [Streptomyces sp. H39-C1]MCZ4099784.1 ricin-type beta-trefoil lectin domain protein [Streptomyces sp. H39-C1]